MGEAYPGLRGRESNIMAALKLEEERFAETLDQGMRILDASIAAMSGDDIEKTEAHLKQKGRFAREEWIEQARELLDGKPPRAKTDRART